jgi:DNA recombination protein RmuC
MDWLTIFAAVAAICSLALLFIQIANWLTGGNLGKAGLSKELDRKLDRVGDIAERTENALRDEHQRMRKEADDNARDTRKELGDNILKLGNSLQNTLSESLSAIDRRVQEFARTHGEFSNTLREEVRNSITALSSELKTDVKVFTEASTLAQETLRKGVTDSLEVMRKDNETKLESMRATVEEKLQGTLEKRLGESFALVSERLELVHKGLGEMQTLAIGVGDLKRVMSNVKDRGGWAEIQLGAMLEQMLARDQYVTNAKMDPASSELVEYAVRMPGQANGGEVLLPIDAKFPKEDYERLVIAWESGNADAARAASEALSAVFETEAKRISTKYIRPPLTTDFAVMYVPTEGLFAEAMRAPGLAHKLQSKYRVTVAGPTTLHALLNSLQMGFRTLAIQKRSGEVWRVLTEAKAEFQRYGDVWEKLSKQLQTAQNTIQDAGTRTRAVERKLKDVELGDGSPVALLQLDASPSEPE